MPQNRQSTPREDAILVRTLGLRLPGGHRIEPHRHAWHQLVYATEGVMTVESPDGGWVVPPERAVWIPARFEHSVRTTGRVHLETLYLRPVHLRPVYPWPECELTGPGACTVIGVTPLLRELILEAMRRRFLHADAPDESRLAAVIRDQIVASDVAPLRVVHPTDPRARRVAERARDDLSATLSIAGLARGSGASVRTIERLFVIETGVPFGRWLQRVKSLHALELLATGASVTEAALAVGYDSTSAFIAMFKRVHGTTPGSYFGSDRASLRGG